MAKYLEIFRIAWPLALGMINNAVMQFADRAFLARESMSSLEAVLPASTLACVFISFFQGIVCYSGVFVAQHHGAGNVRKSLVSYRSGLLLSLVFGFCMFAALPLGKWIFSMTAASAEVVARECAYYDIVTVGAVFLYGQMAVSSFFTGLGKTRIVFWVNLLGNLANIALDYILIFGFSFHFSLFAFHFSLSPQGIAGAACATVIAQALQFFIIYAAARREIRRTSTDGVVGRTPLRETIGDIVRQSMGILRYGIPSGGYEVLNMLSFTIFVFVTGTMGDVEFAASNACFTINYLVYAPLMGFAIGAQTLVGQAMGRKDASAASDNLRRTLVLVMMVVVVLVAATIVFRHPILSLFAPDDPAMAKDFVREGIPLLWLTCAWIFFDAVDTTMSGALKGAGDTRFVFVWMLVCAFAVWLPLVFLVKTNGGSMFWLWSTMVVYAIIIMVGTAIRWRCGRWRSIRLT